MRSLLYEGAVWHERNDPPYRLEHGVFYLSLDLAEAGRLAHKVPIFGYNRFNLLSIRDADYDVLSRSEPGGALTEWSKEPGWRSSLVTIPRIGGYVFNPVSFFLVHDSQATLKHVIAEVHNTWGERHVYELARSDDTNVYRSHATKAFYVSPFLEANGTYDFEIQEDARGCLRILISESTAEGPVFSAGMVLKPKPLSTASLLGALIRYPFLNLKVIGAIHWHALRIWRRGAKFHPHPKPTRHPSEAGK